LIAAKVIALSGDGVVEYENMRTPTASASAPTPSKTPPTSPPPTSSPPRSSTASNSPSNSSAKSRTT
jgi:hypothetical protein